jgi:hypothetical protein
MAPPPHAVRFQRCFPRRIRNPKSEIRNPKSANAILPNLILTLIVVFSALFVVTHLGLSHGAVRQGLVDTLGLWPFRGLYSLISFLTLGPAAVLWWQNRHLGPVLWELPWWPERIIAALLVLFGLLLFFQSLATPSPASMAPAKNEARGVLRITRHPRHRGGRRRLPHGRPFETRER